jgi:hypothetical protein
MVFPWFFPWKMTTGYHRWHLPKSWPMVGVPRSQKWSKIALRNLSFADLEPWRNGVGYKILIDVIYIYKVTTWHAGLSKTLKDKQFK